MRTNSVPVKPKTPWPVSLAICIVLVLSALVVAKIWSTSATPLDSSVTTVIQDLSQRALLVIVGKVISQDTRVEQGIFHTYTTVAVTDTLKGRSVPTIVVRTRGGTIENITEVFPGEATFRLDDEVLLFLEIHDGFYRILDSALGAYIVDTPSLPSAKAVLRVHPQAREIDFVSSPGRRFFEVMDAGISPQAVIDYISAQAR